VPQSLTGVAGLSTQPISPSVQTFPTHGHRQANLTQTQSHTPSQQDETPQYPAHLLARASYINNQNQVKDTLSWILDSGASQHFSNSQSDLKEHKHFREPKKVFLGDNIAVFAEGSGTQLLQSGPYILVLSVWIVPDFRQIFPGIDRPFGGLSCLICGDFFQLPPVGSETLYRKAPSTHPKVEAVAGRILYNHGR
jgi:hypothetical protein